MFHFFDNLTILKRMVLGLTVFLLSLTAYVGITLSNLNALNQQTIQLYQQSFHVAHQVLEAKTAFLANRRLVRTLTYESDPLKAAQYRQELPANYLQYASRMQDARRNYSGDPQLFLQAAADFQRWKTFNDEILHLSQSGQRDEAWRRASDDDNNPTTALGKQLDEILEQAHATAIRHYEISQEKYHATVSTLLLCFALLSLATIALCLPIAGTVTRPLRQLRTSIQKTAEGDYDTPIPRLSEKSEFGDIAASLEVLRQAARAEAQLIQNKSLVSNIAYQLQNSDSFQEFGAILSEQLATAAGLFHAAFYLVDPEKQELRQIAGYACDRTLLRASYSLGEGAAGQAAVSQKKILQEIPLPETPPAVVGSGNLFARHLMFLPIIHQNRALAVMELGKLTPFLPEHSSLIDFILPTAAMNLEILSASLATRQLLQKTQDQALALAASEQQLLARQSQLEDTNLQLAEQTQLLEEKTAELVSQQEELLAQKDELLEQRRSLEISREAMQQLEERNRAILDSVQEGITGVDANGDCVFINRAALNLLGYEKEEELIGRPLHPLIHHTLPNGDPHPFDQCPAYLTSRDGVPRNGSDETAANWVAEEEA